MERRRKAHGVPPLGGIVRHRRIPPKGGTPCFLASLRDEPNRRRNDEGGNRNRARRRRYNAAASPPAIHTHSFLWAMATSRPQHCAARVPAGRDVLARLPAWRNADRRGDAEQSITLG